MNNFRKLLLFSLVVSVALLGSVSVSASPPDKPDNQVRELASVPELSVEPEVMLEALDHDGYPVKGADVMVRSLSDGSGVVFRGKTDGNGRVAFKSKLSKEIIAKAPGNTADAVYEIFFLSPDNELTREVVSVPHVKNRSLAEPNALKFLEKERTKKVSTRFKGEKRPDPKPYATESAGRAAVQAMVCEPLVGYYKACNKTQTYYTADTKIGSFYLASNETVEFTMTSSARVNINIGYKKDYNPWTFNGSVSLSSDVSTSVDYVVQGTCKYFTTLECNLGRDIYATYRYLYESYDVYYGNDYEWTERHVTPVSLIGSSSKENWYTSGYNGKPYQQVLNNQYGSYFTVYNINGSSASTKKSYTTERSFGGAVSITTPVGVFSSNVTTSYKNNHSILWKANSGYRFYHYDIDNTGSNWYVTTG